MKRKYVYSLFMIVSLLPIIALAVIDMDSVSYLNFIKIVALLTFFLSFVTMAIVMMFYTKFIDKEKKDLPDNTGTSDDDDSENIKSYLTNVNCVLDEVKTLLEGVKTKQDDEIVRDGNRDFILNELEKLLYEYKGLEKEEIEKLQNDVKIKEIANIELIEDNKTLTEENSKLKEENKQHVKTINEKEAANIELVENNKTLTGENYKLNKENKQHVKTINEKEAANIELVENNKTLTGENSKLKEENKQHVKTIEEKKAANIELVKNNDNLKAYARYGVELVGLFNDEIADPRIYLAKLRSLFSKYDVLQHHDKMCEEIEGICDEALKTTPVYNNLLTLRDNIIKQFKEELQLQDLPLSDEKKRYNLGKLINIAMVAFDLMDTIEYSINHSKDQKLSVEIALGLKSLKAEIAKCEQVDFDPNKTPRWLRALKSTLELTGADLSNSIISGRRL